MDRAIAFLVVVSLTIIVGGILIKASDTLQRALHADPWAEYGCTFERQPGRVYTTTRRNIDKGGELIIVRSEHGTRHAFPRRQAHCSEVVK